MYLVGVFRLICRTASVEARLALDAVLRDSPTEFTLPPISTQPSIWQHGDCMGCSKDGGVGYMLENSANARMLSGPASFLVTDKPARYAVV